MHSPHPIGLLTIPLELRLSIYDLLFAHLVTNIVNRLGTCSPNSYLNKADDRVSRRYGSAQILRVCRQTYREALTVLNWQKTVYLNRGAHLSSVPRLTDGHRVQSIILRMNWEETSDIREFATSLRPLCMPSISFSNLSSLRIEIDPVKTQFNRYNSRVLRIGVLSALGKIQQTNKQLTLILESASTGRSLISLKLATASAVRRAGVSAPACQRAIKDSNAIKDEVVDWTVELPEIERFETEVHEFVGRGGGWLWSS